MSALNKIYNKFKDLSPMDQDFVNAFLTLSVSQKYLMPSYIHHKILKNLRNLGKYNQERIQFKKLERVLLTMFGTFIPKEIWNKEADKKKLSQLKKFVFGNESKDVDVYITEDPMASSRSRSSSVTNISRVKSNQVDCERASYPSKFLF